MTVERTLEAVLLEVEEIFSALEGIYTPTEAFVWMQSPQPLLNGQVPVDLIQAGEGAAVRAAIATLLEGAFV